MYKYLRVTILILTDIILVNIALWLALMVRFDGLSNIPTHYAEVSIMMTPLITAVRIGCFYLFGLYTRMWSYASVRELMSILYAVSVASLINLVLSTLVMGLGVPPLPMSVFFLTWVFNILLIGGSRLIWRLIKEYGRDSKTGQGHRLVLIVGAGDSGMLLAKELKRHFGGGVKIVGFIDDDVEKQSLSISGIKVLGNRYAIPAVATKYNIEEIILAMPSAGSETIRELVQISHTTGAKVKTLPSLCELVDGNISIQQIREVEIEDLLGRAPISLNLDFLFDFLSGRVVLVTGAGGSIGSELCRQILSYKPKKLLLLDHCENNMYDIEMELRTAGDEVEVVPFVKDVRDRMAVERIFQQHRPYVVFHAAAHKHVPLMEENPEEAVKNNVAGTYTVAAAADRFKTHKFVLVSTDKAVNPTSVMGATKRLAEMIIQHMDKQSSTSFVAVRFGNVLGSKGSVVPLFKKQIAKGGPVTVTHEEMIRYFMTIPEAVQLVLQAGSMAQGGEIFVLDMGDPVRIMDLAVTIIRLSGLEPMRDIDIVVTGMRPGEKLYEELLTDEEGINTTAHKKIFVAKPSTLDGALLDTTIHELLAHRFPKNQEETIAFLQQFLPAFRKEERIEQVKRVKQAQIG